MTWRSQQDIKSAELFHLSAEGIFRTTAGMVKVGSDDEDGSFRQRWDRGNKFFTSETSLQEPAEPTYEVEITG